VADRSVSVPMTLSDLERRRATGQNFLVDLHNYARSSLILAQPHVAW